MNLPVPLIGPETEMASRMGHAPFAGPLGPPRERRRDQFPVDANRNPVVLDWQLAAERCSHVLAPQAQLGYEGAISLHVVCPHVVKQPPPSPDQLHQSPTGVMVVLVHL